MSRTIGIGHRPQNETIDISVFEKKIKKLTTKVTELEQSNKDLVEKNEALVSANTTLTTKVTELERSNKGDK